jgi:hypothetical protein
MNRFLVQVVGEKFLFAALEKAFFLGISRTGTQEATKQTF